MSTTCQTDAMMHCHDTHQALKHINILERWRTLWGSLRCFCKREILQHDSCGPWPWSYWPAIFQLRNTIVKSNFAWAGNSKNPRRRLRKESLVMTKITRGRRHGEIGPGVGNMFLLILNHRNSHLFKRSNFFSQIRREANLFFHPWFQRSHPWDPSCILGSFDVGLIVRCRVGKDASVITRPSKQCRIWVIMDMSTKVTTHGNLLDFKAFRSWNMYGDAPQFAQLAISHRQSHRIMWGVFLSVNWRYFGKTWNMERFGLPCRKYSFRTIRVDLATWCTVFFRKPFKTATVPVKWAHRKDLLAASYGARFESIIFLSCLKWRFSYCFCVVLE